jgi:hypothetical protein
MMYFIHTVARTLGSSEDMVTWLRVRRKGLHIPCTVHFLQRTVYVLTRIDTIVLFSSWLTFT